MGITSVVSSADQGTFLAEARRLVDQHEADTADMRELRQGFTDIGFPWPTLAQELRALARAAEWHIAGRVSATGLISENADEVELDVAEVKKLREIYRNALEYAEGEGVDLGPVGRAFLRIRIDAGGFVGASAWVTAMRRHYEQSGVKGRIPVSERFVERLYALADELEAGRTEVHQTEQVLIQEAGSAEEAIEAMITRLERLWRARNVVADRNGRKEGYPGFDLAYIRGALARRRLQREKEAAVEPAPDTQAAPSAAPAASSPNGAAPLPGLGNGV